MAGGACVANSGYVPECSTKGLAPQWLCATGCSNPELRLTDPAVRIPRLEVVAPERLAARDGETVSAVLARELLDLVSVHSAWLSAEVPGFAAVSWPS